VRIAQEKYDKTSEETLFSKGVYDALGDAYLAADQDRQEA